MSIVPSNRRNTLSTNTIGNAMAMLNHLQQNPQYRANVLSAIKAIGKSVGFPTGQPTESNIRTFAPQGAYQGRRKRKGKGRKSRVPRGIFSNPDTYRAQFRVLFNLTTVTTTGNLGYNVWLGYKNTNASTDMTTLSSQMTNLSNTFAYMTWNRLSVTYVPATPFTTSGSHAVSFQSDMTTPATAASSLQQVIQRRVNAISDIKESSCYIWTPENEQEREAKLTDNASSASLGALRTYAPGIVSGFLTTNQTSGATNVGYLDIEMDVTFSELQ